MERKVRVRFAPSPTGYLHIGGLRTALYNYLFAKKHQGDFILRIEDTDIKRTMPQALDYIQSALRWTNLLPNEGYGIDKGEKGPYRQSERISIYKKYIAQLLNAGFAYRAFDTVEELDKQRKKHPLFAYNYITRASLKNELSLSSSEINSRLQNKEPYVVRIKVPNRVEIKMQDQIRGNLLVHSSSLDDKVLCKADGMPTYHLANVVDDYLMNISHVIRGEEWLPSLPIHFLLYEYLSIKDCIPEFAHLPLILSPDGKGKLSKRHSKDFGIPVFPIPWEESQEDFSNFKDEGYLPSALVNYLALLGWGSLKDTEIHSTKQMAFLFELNKISKSAAKFDLNKCQHINQMHIKSLRPANILSALRKSDNIPDAWFDNPQYLSDVLNLVQDRMYFIDDFKPQASFFFELPQVSKKEIKALVADFKLFEMLIKDYVNFLKESTESFNALLYENLWIECCNVNKVKKSLFIKGLRFMVSGRKNGPPIFEVLAVLKVNIVIKRLEFFLAIK